MASSSTVVFLHLAKREEAQYQQEQQQHHVVPVPPKPNANVNVANNVHLQHGNTNKSTVAGATDQPQQQQFQQGPPEPQGAHEQEQEQEQEQQKQPRKQEEEEEEDNTAGVVGAAIIADENENKINPAEKEVILADNAGHDDGVTSGVQKNVASDRTDVSSKEKPESVIGPKGSGNSNDSSHSSNDSRSNINKYAKKGDEDNNTVIKANHVKAKKNTAAGNINSTTNQKNKENKWALMLRANLGFDSDQHNQ